MNEWLVFFTNTQEKQWWNKIGLTRPGFEHCLAVQYSPHHNQWTMLDWNLSGLDTVILDSLDLHHLFAWAEKYDGTVVRYKAPRIDFKKKVIRIFPISCVVMVQHALHLNTRGLFTPYQLYRHLINTGGNIVRGKENG